jgi:hypothetical protein
MNKYRIKEVATNYNTSWFFPQRLCQVNKTSGMLWWRKVDINLKWETLFKNPHSLSLDAEDMNNEELILAKGLIGFKTFKEAADWIGDVVREEETRGCITMPDFISKYHASLLPDDVAIIHSL